MFFRERGQEFETIFRDEYAVADLGTIVFAVGTAVDCECHSCLEYRLVSIGELGASLTEKPIDRPARNGIG